MAEIEVGVVIHYFGKIGVAAVRVTAGDIKVGDTIRVKGHTTDLTLTIASIQMEHGSVPSARAGDDVGIKVPGIAREHDAVFKIVD
ncbi:MAG TPA: EF-Tu/IF-2/RF-3 family GTPase [Thermoanaerobaculales bacterium]|nr:EF-Tu/IF-2/RF-3 family GTPase [Thermoanaerobaculales bacterium]HPA81925.1 EF-Tu/IF-2/RF-3 family GTPase [Thermoanaerobaculales bacterium]HQL28754.1 EF-Tu/IF-2/RF-3 family GTPase [Thermoanaerobaculales bacterium]HQN96136.1 EF-Tu/IF-2/RF-3 family GTPase [Thermoanaerobaculales bacterium]HQP44046.1 EF-Tu/IF-2/RF-3 family GTPase [Thermoanaerobaculales bacterium]